MIWLGKWRLCRRSECWDCEPLDLHDKVLARQWLQQFKTDPASMGRLRGLLSENYDIWRIGGMNENDVIDQIANHLSSGNLRVCPQLTHHSQATSTSATPEPVPFPLSERRPRASTVFASPPMSDPPSFSPDVDLAAQAATLVAAAAGGKPFCPE